MDTPETLAADMLKAAAASQIATRALVRASAEAIKKEWQANVAKSAPRHNAGAADAITYNTGFELSATWAEIGYDKSRAGGSLGNLLEYGGGGDHSPPHRDGGRALDVEEPKFAEALGLAVNKLL